MENDNRKYGAYHKNKKTGEIEPNDSVLYQVDIVAFYPSEPSVWFLYASPGIGSEVVFVMDLESAGKFKYNEADNIREQYPRDKLIVYNGKVLKVLFASVVIASFGKHNGK